MTDGSTHKKRFTAEEVCSVDGVSNPGISQDGTMLVHARTSVRNGVAQDSIIITELSSGKIKKTIDGYAPKWSPVAPVLAYYSSHEQRSAIFIYDVLKNETKLLTELDESDYFVDHYTSKDFQWSPDGTMIAFLTAVQPQKKSAGNVRVFNHLLYRSKGGRGRSVFSDDKRTHLHVISVGTGKVLFALDGPNDEHSISWSPDNKKICYISNTTGNPDRNQYTSLHVVDITTGETSVISGGKKSAFQPAWSPDGRFIAYLGINAEVSTNDSPAEDTQLYVVSPDTGEAKCLTAAFDRRIEQLRWHHQSTDIYFTAGNEGDIHLYSISIATLAVTTIIAGTGKVIEYTTDAHDNNIVYVHMDSANPADLFKYNLLSSETEQLTDIRAALSASYQISKAEMFWFKSFDNTPIQAWILKPSGFDPQRTYPLILVIHGGPHNMFGEEFDTRMQVLAAEGYAVLYMNPRGSSGYGQTFSNGCVRSWGEGDYEDLMSGVDAAVAKFGWIDKNRLGVTGQSYGGYMTNRIITKTDRFKSAVADGSICNLISFAGTSLYHSLMESEFGENVYENFELLWKCSPLKDVKNVRTPVLFVHGETDNEVPFSQAEEMFIAVKKMNVDTELVQYVGEGHGWRPDLLPVNKTDLLRRMVEWFNKYI